MIAIEGIEVTPSFIGCGVTYKSHPAAPLEDGTITGFNDHYIFVRFGDFVSKACRPENLLWGPAWLAVES